MEEQKLTYKNKNMVYFYLKNIQNKCSNYYIKNQKK